MARVKNIPASKKRRKKLLTEAKGYWCSRSNLYGQAKDTVRRALRHSFRDRRQRKREFRRLWIARINAACRMNGITYNSFINGLKNAEVDIDRKVLADIALKDPAGFKQLIDTAQSALAQNQA